MKQNLTLASLVLAGCAVYSVASAQSIHTFPGKLQAPEAPAATHKAPLRAPLNQERALGTKIFATSIANGNRTPVYFNIYTGDTNKIYPLANVKSDEEDINDPYRIVSIKSAAQVGNDGYYVFKTRNYSIGPAYPEAFEKVDPKTGKFTVVKDLSDLQSNWTQIYSLAYNPATEELWGLMYGKHQGLDGGVASSMVKIDLTTGDADLSSEIELYNYYYAIAFDYDGTLWGVSWLNDGKVVTGNRLDELDEYGEIVSQKELKVDDRAFIGYYQHGLGFDYNTGDLYWFATNNEGSQYVIRVNPDNSTTEKLGPTGFANIAIGPHIAYRTADDRKAPALVQNLAFTASPTGENKVTLTWTNPDKTWNRKALKDLSKVYVYRDNMTSAPVAELDAAAGAAMSWEDTGATQGIHTYYVVGVNAAGKKGIADSIEAFVGRDVPGPVTELKAETFDGKTVNLSWETPAKGDNDGWYDKTSLKYTIVRMPDNVEVAKDITARSFKDAGLALAQTYTYEVTASNADGKGGKAVSEGVLAGNSMAIPFSLSFNEAVDASRFKVIDRNGDGQTMAWDVNNNDSPNHAMKFLLSNFDNDDLLVSPALNLKKGTSYKVEYTVSFGRLTGQGVEDHFHHFAITAGEAATAEAQVTQQDFPNYLVSTMYQRSKVTGYVTSPVDGDYFIGLDVLTSGEKNAWLYVEDINIVELKDTDIQAMSLEAGGVISNKTDNAFKVTVFNAGSKDAADYTVQVMAQDKEGNEYVVATAPSVPVIAPKATETVAFSGYNTAIPTGTDYLLYAQIEMAGDAKPENDATPAKSAIVVSNLPTVVTGASREMNTAVPIYFYDKYSATQTVYSPAMTGLNDKGQVNVYGFGIPYNSDRDIAGTKVQVYMSTSSYINGFSSTEKTWLTDGLVKCFEGEIAISRGDGMMYFDFAEPYTYQANENLIITINTIDNTVSGTWPVRFAVFDANWNNAIYHCQRVNGASQLDAESADISKYAYSYPYANELYLVADAKGNGQEGVDVVTTGAGLRFANGVLHANADMSSVAVYTLQGQLVKRLAPNAASAALKLSAGTYLVSAKTAEGNKIVKVIVK